MFRKEQTSGFIKHLATLESRLKLHMSEKTFCQPVHQLRATGSQVVSAGGSQRVVIK